MEIQEEEQAWVEAVEWEALVRPRLRCLPDSRVGVGHTRNRSPVEA